MKAIIVFTLSTLLLSGCSSQTKVDNSSAYDVSREEDSTPNVSDRYPSSLTITVASLR
jgi:uncharacterized protein YcfL